MFQIFFQDNFWYFFGEIKTPIFVSKNIFQGLKLDLKNLDFWVDKQTADGRKQTADKFSQKIVQKLS